MIKLVIKDQIPSGKNQQQIVMMRGRFMKFPNKRFKLWRALALLQIQKQLGANWTPMIVKNCKMTVEYWSGDLLSRDVSGMIDALFHLLEKAAIVKDDSLIKNLSWTYRGLERANPRVEITLEGIDDK